MINRISNQVQLQQAVPGSRQQAQSAGFQAALRQELAKNPVEEQGVAFSKHAISRAEERGIEITPNLIDQLKGSMIRAQAKGAKNILAMDTE